MGFGWITAILFYVAIGGVIGGLILRLALWPAFRMSGARRGRQFSLFSACFLMAATWTGTTAVAQVAMMQAGTWQYAGPTPQVVLVRPWLLVIAALAYAAGGALAGCIAARTTPLPRIVEKTAIAGLIVGALFVAQTAGIFQNPRPRGGWTIATMTAWLILPIAALYWSAVIQRKRRERYHRAACVACGYELAATKPQCTECGVAPQHICHKCRHIVDRQPGQTCPRCKATIGAHCWKCGYDLRGVHAGRCPECGVWKPVRADRNETVAAAETSP